MLIHQAGVWIKNKWIPPLLTGVRHRFHETWIKHYIPEKILLSWVENDCSIWRGGQENGKAWTDKHTPFTDAKKRRTPLTNMPQLWCTEVASCLKAVRWTWQRPWILVFAENQAADRGTGCMLWQLSQHQNLSSPSIHMNSSPLEFLSFNFTCPANPKKTTKNCLQSIVENLAISLYILARPGLF